VCVRTIGGKIKKLHLFQRDAKSDLKKKKKKGEGVKKASFEPRTSASLMTPLSTYRGKKIELRLWACWHKSVDQEKRRKKDWVLLEESGRGGARISNTGRDICHFNPYHALGSHRYLYVFETTDFD